RRPDFTPAVARLAQLYGVVDIRIPIASLDSKSAGSQDHPTACILFTDINAGTSITSGAAPKQNELLISVGYGLPDLYVRAVGARSGSIVHMQPGGGMGGADAHVTVLCDAHAVSKLGVETHANLVPACRTFRADRLATSMAKRQCKVGRPIVLVPLID